MSKEPTGNVAEPSAATPAEQAKAPAAKKKRKPPKHKESIRDTVESILFAFVLAFLFRTFEAEAFVIPTGSMAPTLYGRHKDSYCRECSAPIVVGASQEVDPETGYLSGNARVRSAVCSNCGYENTELKNDLAFNGDRILVNKFPYELSDPQRWDVFVFKYPSEPKTNYIKRLVGLPGETIRIQNGNLFRVTEQSEELLRKDPPKQRSLQIPVYDDNHPPRALLAANWPERWASMSRSSSSGVAGWEDSSDWSAPSEDRVYSVSALDADEPRWLRYRHYFAKPKDWRALESEQPLAPQLRLIGDFCGYNATVGNPNSDARVADDVDFGPFWTPELTVNFEVEIKQLNDSPLLMLELCQGTSWRRCRINPGTGEAVLEEVDSQFNERVRELGKAQTALRGAGRYAISYANVDNRLLLWIDDALVDFGEGATLESEGATGYPFPTNQDLMPVGIAVAGMDASVANLFLERDVYYRAVTPNNDFREVGHRLSQVMNDPERWAEVYQRYGAHLGERLFRIPDDHFLAFGDNSPQSNDSRSWKSDLSTVPRQYLVGKAFWIYWPHGVPFLNGGRGFPITYHHQLPPGRSGKLLKAEDYPRYTVPFYPQFSRMTRIR